MSFKTCVQISVSPPSSTCTGIGTFFSFNLRVFCNYPLFLTYFYSLFLLWSFYTSSVQKKHKWDPMCNFKFPSSHIFKKSKEMGDPDLIKSLQPRVYFTGTAHLSSEWPHSGTRDQPVAVTSSPESRVQYLPPTPWWSLLCSRLSRRNPKCVCIFPAQFFALSFLLLSYWHRSQCSGACLWAQLILFFSCCCLLTTPVLASRLSALSGHSNHILLHTV